HEDVPVDVAIVSQHRKRRDAGALYDDVALPGIFHAAHAAHTFIQVTAPAQLLVIELVEEAQEQALHPRRRARSAQGSDVLDRLLADLARVLARAAAHPDVELDRAPARELHAGDVRVDASLYVAEGKGPRQEVEIEPSHLEVRREARGLPERVGERDIARRDRAVEHVEYQRATHAQR